MIYIKTDCIKELLKLYFPNKDVFTSEEMDFIKVINVNRFNQVGEFNKIDFNELMYLKNLEVLNIKQCIIDLDIFNIITKIGSLKTLCFDSCEIISDLNNFIRNLGVDNLIIENTNFDFRYFEFLYLNSLEIANCDINTNFSFNAKRIDVSKCRLNDIEFITTNKFDELIVSEKQYSNYSFKNFDGHIYVRDIFNNISEVNE